MSSQWLPGAGDGDIIGTLVSKLPDAACPQCNSPFPEGKRFCGECGYQRKAENVCKNCNHALRPGAKFCQECGAQPGSAPSAKSQPVKTKMSVPSGRDWSRDSGAKDVSGPLCAACNQPISGRTITALDKPWHPDCFVCTQCAKAFEDGSFAMKGGKAVCTNCVAWEKKNGAAAVDRAKSNATASEKADANRRIQGGKTNCMACSQVITGDGLFFNQGFYHSKCLVCPECNKALQVNDEDLVLRGGKPVHKKCAASVSSGSTCAGCGKGISGKFLKQGGKSYHKQCFTCSHCSGDLSSGYVERNGEQLCGTCASKSAKGPTMVSGPRKVVGSGIRFNQFTGKVIKGDKISGAEKPKEISVAVAPNKFCSECGTASAGGGFCAECGTKL